MNKKRGITRSQAANPSQATCVLYQPLGAPVVKKIDAGHNQSQAPGQEKHVKSPQGVNGRNSLRPGIGK